VYFETDSNFEVCSKGRLCYVGTCHHGVVRPRVADGRDTLQTWRVAANILNKQSRIAD
jgi:hypothetical protein